MNEKLIKYLNGVFSAYENLDTVKELKEELYIVIQDKFEDFKDQGYDDETAYSMTIDSIGDIKEIIESIPDKTKEFNQMERSNFSMRNLKDSDLKGIKVHEGNFDASDLRGSDLSTSDLSHSSFRCSVLRNTRFDGADLTEARFIFSDMKNVSFDGANLTGAKFTMAAVINSSFKNCILDNANFSSSDLSGIYFDNSVFNNTIFNKSALDGTSFKNAVLRNVTFKTNYKANVRKAIFDGATMDKLTYAVLKGIHADLSNVVVI